MAVVIMRKFHFQKSWPKNSHALHFYSLPVRINSTSEAILAQERGPLLEWALELRESADSLGTTVTFPAKMRTL